MRVEQRAGHATVVVLRRVLLNAGCAVLASCGTLQREPQLPPALSTVPQATALAPGALEVPVLPRPARPGAAAPRHAPGGHAVSQDEKRRGYVRYLVRKFKVNAAIADQITQSACRAGARFRLSPALLLAIMAVESSYNPVAFNGRDVGLMQVSPSSHPEKMKKIGGVEKLYEIDENILVGAWVLREFRNRTHSMHDALLRYAGSRRAGKTYPRRVEAQRVALEHAYGSSLPIRLDSAGSLALSPASSRN